MTRDEILAEIRRVAGARGGRLGMAAFFKATGIPEKQVLGKHFATWNEALTAAGLATTTFLKARVDDAVVLEAIAHLVERSKKWPTENEFSLERRRDASFPSLKLIRRLRQSGELPQRVHALCEGRPDLTHAASIARALVSSLPARELPVGRAPVQGYVYMMRSGRSYKIGHTNSPVRRHREVRVELPDPTTLVHTIETDDPGGIEAYWHRRFGAKRVRDTEFFKLDVSDVAAFKRRKYQ
jgi:hypothetical protein